MSSSLPPVPGTPPLRWACTGFEPPDRYTPIAQVILWEGQRKYYTLQYWNADLGIWLDLPQEEHP